mmetsp:Transcript_128663/g.274611  ORF Transcript_128663/g.274611 Transcript_128663/m.274611 type:complete len:279 (-) Transcript_128663:12-848(-)
MASCLRGSSPLLESSSIDDAGVDGASYSQSLASEKRAHELEEQDEGLALEHGADGEVPQATLPQPLPKKAHAFLRRSSGRGVTGAQQTSKRPDSKSAGLLPFLRGTGTDSHGRTLEEILDWDFERMEKVHDYVQWIFPTDERSRHNLSSPLLTPGLQQILRRDPALQATLRRCLQKFSAFLGLEWYGGTGDLPLTVRKADHFESRYEVCWHTRFGGNHNWLRISRVLHCLRLAGMAEEAAALLARLEALHAEGVPCDSAMKHWRARAAVVACVPTEDA